MSQNKPKSNPNLFVKGDPKAIEGGKKSRRRVPADLREARAAFKNDVEKVMYDFSKLSKSEMLKKLNDKDATALELLVLSIMQKGIVKGDQQRLGFILDRTIGKVKEVVQTENINYNVEAQVTEVDLKDRIGQLKEAKKVDEK